jgi:large subunit ribosomal protein L25
MPDIVVAAQSRTETGKNVNRRLRVAGLIPGVLYGSSKKAPQPLSVSPKDITAVLRSASGLNTLFDLDFAGSKRKVILKEFQVEPVKGRLLHADFYEVALDKKLHVNVHIEIVGTAVGVKVEGGVLDFITRELEVECLPKDIPEKITVDVSDLSMGKHVRVADIKAPERVTILTEPDVVIVHVVMPRAEEEPVAAAAAEAAPVEGAAAAEPEVIKKGKTAAEGEPAAEEKGAEKKADKKEKK